jgi:mannose-6-phosphate isomerase-like protein (cupin superfamily)
MKIVSLIDLPERHVSHNPEIRKKVMLETHDLPHVTGFSQARFSPGLVASPHAHADMHEVFLVNVGAGMIRVDGEVHQLEAGTCVAVAPGEVHEVANTGSTDLVLTYFGVKE